MDWSSFTKGYFLNRDTLVGVLLLIDASIPPQKIDLDCANWLGRNNVSQLFLNEKNESQFAFQLIIFFHLLFVLNIFPVSMIGISNVRLYYNRSLTSYMCCFFRLD